MGCYRRIDRALEHALHLPLGTGSRYVVISDCHRGEGTTNDNFLKNAYLYEAAMEHYIKRGFFYLELGDGEELWENRCMDRIVHYHETCMRCLLVCKAGMRCAASMETTIWS